MLRSLTGFFWKGSAAAASSDPQVLFQLENCTSNSEPTSLSLCKESTFTYSLKTPTNNIAVANDLQIEIDSLNKVIILPAQNLRIALSPSTNKPTLDTFKLLLAQALYEARTSKPHTEASDADLEAIVDEFCTQQPAIGTEVLRASALSFYEYDPLTRTFKPFSPSPLPVTAVLHRLNERAFEFVLHIGNAQGRLYSQKLHPEVNEHVDKGTLSFVWCSPALEDVQGSRTFCLRFPNGEALGTFSTAFGQCVWQTANEEAWDRVSAADSTFLLSRYQPMDIDSEESESESESEAESDSESSSEFKDFSSHNDPAEANRLLAIGWRDRSFVSRGSSIGVFKDDSGTFDFVTSIKDVKTLGGQSLHPDQIMLHDQDSTLLLRSATADPSKVYKMDLSRGKIVDEWSVDEGTRHISSIVPASKHAQETPEQTLIGISNSSIYRLDPRLPSQDKKVEAQAKSYTGKTQFSCGTTTASGALAVASEKGEIRLFDQLDKRAKSLIPGFGDAILGVDTLPSGRFILATCKTYLLLIDTSLDAGGGAKNAFYKSSVKDRKPPIRLSLRPEHVAFLGAISFTNAHFSCASGADDSKSSAGAGAGVFIVTSTGPNVVMWPLDKVLKGRLFDYQIKKYGECVVADNFRYGQDDSIVVALPHDIQVAAKGTLKSFK